ncbi:MAG TPA: PQQ-binding-like beta-propeller repeat protein [Planctomycetota bacterium]|nr:PQQ-binding-like beta-propeller repeat protein [Planctomycetota bacterium]
MLKNLSTAMMILSVFAGAAPSADWPEFRGASRDGKSTETGLLAKWPQSGPKLLWSVDDVGSGFTHVVVAKGLLYVNGMVDKQGVLRAYTLDGKLKWQANYGDEWFKNHPGSRSIPTIRDGLIYVGSGVGNVACFDAATGKPVWSLKLFDKYEAPQIQWGYAESFVIDGENLIATPMGKKAAMVALNRKTGEEVWTSPPLPGHESSFCSPLLVEHRGTRMLVTMTDRGVVAFSPADGSILWQLPYKSPRGNHPDTPIYHEGLLYVVSGYGKGAIGLELSDDGRSAKQIWEQRRQDPVHGQAVLVDGCVYAASHQSSRKWSCVELKTGKLMWEDGAVGKSGSVIYADGMLYGYSEDGNVGLLRPTPERCEVVSSFKVPMGEGPHWAHPVIAEGRLFIRHGNALMCYDISAAGGGE